MGKIKDVLIVFAILFLVGGQFHHEPKVSAQTATLPPFTIIQGGGLTHTGCPALTSTQTPATCYPSDGVYYAAPGTTTSTGGTGWTLWPQGSSASGVLKVQGVAPGTTGNVSLTCTVTLPAGTPITLGTTTATTVAPATITAACTGAGN